MALTYSNFSSFKEVVDHYNRIKPLIGKLNAGKDIRPIGDRNRKFERIIKISNSCYALSDGWHFGLGPFGSLYSDIDHGPNALEKYAPIVWRKLRDGRDQVTLRNGWGSGGHNSRYAFLDRHSPRPMRFSVGSGKQYMNVHSFGGIRNHHEHTAHHFLAKVRTTPRAVLKAMTRDKSFFLASDDNSAVVFTRKGSDDWEHVVGTGTQVAPSRVDKKTKAKFKEDIQKLFEWGMTMSPLLMLEDRVYTRNLNQEMSEWISNSRKQGAPYPMIGHTAWHGSKLPLCMSLYRSIVRDEDHPKRLHLWVQFARDCIDRRTPYSFYPPDFLVKTVETTEELAAVRAKYNTFINRELGFLNRK